MTGQSSASVPLYAPALSSCSSSVSGFFLAGSRVFLLCSFLRFLVSRLGSAPVFLLLFSPIPPVFLLCLCLCPVFSVQDEDKWW